MDTSIVGRPTRAVAPSPALAAVEASAVRQLPFAGAIGLSAFLLFSLELLAGRLVLPVFGGSPAVWTTSLCFFTAILFLGYLYADLLTVRVPVHRAIAVHLVVGLLAVGATIIAPANVAALRNPALPEAINVILALGVVAGGPAFLLATTTPLLSAWYTARGGRSPWWLYATSNGASFLGLLAYPFLVEPTDPLSAQRVGFAVGVLAMTGLLAILASGVRRSVRRATTADAPLGGVAEERLTAPVRSRLSGRRQLIWLAAAFVPAGLLSATTNYLETDLISAPLIWVGPLAVYLATFVVAFSGRGRPWVARADRLVPAAATLLWVPYVQPGVWPVVPLLAVELGSFFVVAVAIHGHLAYDLPADRHVTRFYLILAAGGMLATAFVALVAPIAFSTVLEYPLLIGVGLIVLSLLPRTPRDHGAAMIAPSVPPTGRRSPPVLGAVVARLVPYALVGAVLVLLIARDDMSVARNVLGFLLLGMVAVIGGLTPRALALTTAIVLTIAVAATTSGPLLRVRTFFGVIEVRGADQAHLEISGTTLHGMQFTDERRSEPTTYYVRDGSVGQLFDVIRARTPNARIGVVGLGVGTLASYTKAGDQVTYYEIDQAVVDIARNPAYFTYLADAPRPARIVVGDARLSLLDAPSGAYDVLFLDAFTSDSVPAHLLTREAVAAYERVLAPGGILVFNMSNRYYDVASAVGATVRSAGLDALSRYYVPSPDLVKRLDASASIWLVAGTPDTIAPFANLGWSQPGPGPILTDDYSDLLRTLRVNGLF